jgi:hypothetical protein
MKSIYMLVLLLCEINLGSVIAFDSLVFIPCSLMASTGEGKKHDNEDEDDEEEDDDELAAWMNTSDSNGVNALIAACSGGHIHCLKVSLCSTFFRVSLCPRVSVPIDHFFVCLRISDFFFEDHP